MRGDDTEKPPPDRLKRSHISYIDRANKCSRMLQPCHGDGGKLDRTQRAGTQAIWNLGGQMWMVKPSRVWAVAGDELDAALDQDRHEGDVARGRPKLAITRQSNSHGRRRSG